MLDLFFRTKTNIIRKFFLDGRCYELSTLYFDRINFYKGIGVNTTSALADCTICHYDYFLDKESINDVSTLSNIAILNIHGVDCGCIVNGVTTSHKIYWENHLLQKFSPTPSPSPFLRSMLMGLHITPIPCCGQITDPQQWYRGGGVGS